MAKGECQEKLDSSMDYPFDVRDLQFEIPTVINSLLVSKASPMSIDIAATSKQEENETTNTMPGQRKHTKKLDEPGCNRSMKDALYRP